MKYFFVAALFTFHLSLLTSCSHQEKSPVESVDPFIGTAGTGHTFPGACVPFGMVQLSPDTKTTGWEHCSGYHFDDSTIQGFSHTHLSGTGCGDLGDIMFMPSQKENLNLFPFDSTYEMGFSHKNEKSSAGFYSVELNDGIQVELTATERCGFQHYIFQKDKKQFVMLDLLHGISDNNSKSHIQQSPNGNVVLGWRESNGWANDEKIFFAAVFSKSIDSMTITYEIEDSKLEKKQNDSLRNQKICISLDKENSNDLFVKVGISYVSSENALKNLEAEIPDWNFEAVKDSAKEKWQRALSKIEVKISTLSKTHLFRT